MVENVVLDVCNFLKSKSILISSQNQWLRGCIACFRENSHDFSLNQLEEFVFNQWKLADLKDVRSPSLPNNCKTASKLTLPGKYAVQINYVVNISESYFKQLQRIRRPAAENNLSVDTEKDKSNETSNVRTLKLEITDGIVTVFGFEDKPIRTLAEPFVPGVKVVLNGPIECRKGVLFLKNENIAVFGGEVDSLHVPNAPENVLARALGQPENDEPYKSLICPEENYDDNQFEDIVNDDTDAFLQVTDDIENTYRSVESSNSASFPSVSTSRMPVSSNRNSKVTKGNDRPGIYTLTDSVSNSFNRSTSKSIENNSYVGNGSSYGVTVTTTESRSTIQDLNENKCANSSVVELDGDDEYFAMMAAETASVAEKSQTLTTPKQTSINAFFSSKNTTDLSKSKTGGTELNRNSHRVNQTLSGQEKSTLQQKSVDKSIEKSNYKRNFDVLEKSQSTSTTSAKEGFLCAESQEEKVTGDLFKEFEVIENDLILKNHQKRQETTVFPPKKYPCTLTIRGSVQRISQKLSIQSNEWALSAIVKLKNNDKEVDFSSETLDKIFGMTAKELQAKRQLVHQDPELKLKINTTLKSVQKRIQRLDCDMKIHFSSYIATPLVVEIFE